jgi:hypothetical protein
VSIKGESWFQIIQAHIASLMQTTENAHPFNPSNAATATAIELEKTWYRDIFNSYYPGCAHVLPYYWLPRWSYDAQGQPVQDPSARVLSVYRD